MGAFSMTPVACSLGNPTTCAYAPLCPIADTSTGKSNPAHILGKVGEVVSLIVNTQTNIPPQ